MSGLVSNSTWQKLGQNLDFTTKYQRMKRKMLKGIKDLKRPWANFKLLLKLFQLQGAVHEPYRASKCLVSRFQFPKHPPIVQHLWKLTTICYSHCFVQHTYAYIINTCPSSILRTDSCISLAFATSLKQVQSNQDVQQHDNMTAHVCSVKSSFVQIHSTEGSSLQIGSMLRAVVLHVIIFCTLSFAGCQQGRKRRKPSIANNAQLFMADGSGGQHRKPYTLVRDPNPNPNPSSTAPPKP